MRDGCRELLAPRNRRNVVKHFLADCGRYSEKRMTVYRRNSQSREKASHDIWSDGLRDGDCTYIFWVLLGYDHKMLIIIGLRGSSINIS